MSSLFLNSNELFEAVVIAGSWDTLEVRPKEKGIDTREELIKFYKEYYSANLMRLVVYAKGSNSFAFTYAEGLTVLSFYMLKCLFTVQMLDSLDKIESWVECKFQDIPNTNRNSLSFPGEPCTSDHLQVSFHALYQLYVDI